MLDIFGVYAQFGITGLIIACLGFFAVILFKMNGRIKPMEENLKKYNNTCSTCTENRRQSDKDLVLRIDKLELNRETTNGKLTNIEIKLDNTEKTVEKVDNNVLTIMNHFALKGMDK